MAFQSGSQVRPELGNADFSGFGRAAEIQAASAARLGESIASGIKGYKAKKKQAKVDQAKISRAIAFGESMIDMLGEEHPLSDSIADTLAMSFGSEIPFDQQVASTDGLTDAITNMFLMTQQNEPIRTVMTPSGTEMIMQGNKVIDTTTAYQQGKGGDINVMDFINNPPSTVAPEVTPTPLTAEEIEEAQRLQSQNI